MRSVPFLKRQSSWLFRNNRVNRGLTLMLGKPASGLLSADVFAGEASWDCQKGERFGSSFLGARLDASGAVGELHGGKGE